MTTIELITQLPLTPDEAFDLSLDVNVHADSMAASREAAVAGITSGRMTLNDQVTWRAWHFGVPWRMTSRISDLQRPSCFVDEQVKGPFARFRHEHIFETVGNATRMIDRIEFAAPLGWFGLLAERLVLEGYLTTLIERRNAYLVLRARQQ